MASGRKRFGLIGRLAFRLFLAVIWLTVICAVLETYSVLRWKWIETHNPFVAAFKANVSTWPRLDIDSSGAVSQEQLTFLKSVSAERAAAPQKDDDHLGTLFAALSEDDRKLYAKLNEIAILAYDREGNPLGVYATKPNMDAIGQALENVAGKPFRETPLASKSGDGIRLIHDVIDSGAPGIAAYQIEGPGGPQQVEVSCFPMSGPDGKAASCVTAWRNVTGLGLTESLARKQDDKESPMWKKHWFEYRKNAKLSPRWFTNNVGFRDDDLALPKPPGVFRIVCTGGSTTEEGLGNELTYPNILEKKLREHFGDSPRIEVVNCGVVGLDLISERKRTLDYARLEPDLVLDYNAVNDICHALMPRLDAAATGLKKTLQRSRFIQANLNDLLWPDDATVKEMIKSMAVDNLEIMREVYKSKGVEMAICGFAYPDMGKSRRNERDYFEHNLRTYWQGKNFSFASYRRFVDIYDEMAKSLCEKNGMLYIPLEKEMQGTLVEFGDICHLRPKGIERKADVISRALIPRIEEILAKRSAH
jgi:hypothetical protein